MNPRKFVLRSLIVLCLIASLEGCARWNLVRLNDRQSAKFFAVHTESTAFYVHSPQPGLEPDKTLPRDTLVSLIRPSFGFCKVRLTSGEQGFVRNDDLALASQSLIASANASPAASTLPALPQPNPPDARLVPPDPSSEFEPTPIPEPPLPSP